MKKKIMKGDIVRVDFNNSQFSLINKGKILNRFVNGWEIEDLITGDIHCITEGCTVSKLESENENR